MEFEINLISVLLLAGSGFLAGFINTIAGGGSMLTLPAFMMLGLPGEVANATNRVGVFLQSVAGVRGFHRNNKLPASAIVPTMVPTLSGALLGALFAAYMPSEWQNPVLLGTIITMAAVMLIFPSVIAPPEGTPVFTPGQRPAAWAGLFIAGLYGGFIQAGVGFILIAAIAGGLRYDLARTNALKMLITGAITLVALAVFIIEGLVMWIPGLLMAAGSMIGASMSVKVAISIPQNTLKWILFSLVVFACVLAYFEPFKGITG